MRSSKKLTLVLASQSPARRHLLTKLLRVSFPRARLLIRPAWLDEDGLLRKEFGPSSGRGAVKTTLDLKTARRMAATLARAKAEACRARGLGKNPSGKRTSNVGPAPKTRVAILGSDQLVFLPHRLQAGGEILGKPGSNSEARRMLKKCSNRTAFLVTSVCVFTLARSSWKARVKTQVIQLEFASLSKEEITRIVALDKPSRCAGSFKFEEHGAALFRSVRTDDPTGIQGLPIMRVKELLSFS